MRLLLCLVPLLLAGRILAETPPSPEALVAQNTLPFAYTATELTGPGGEFLREQTARSQFVLLGEMHMDHEVPIFAGALCTMLHGAHGFRHLVVEQDPVAAEDALAPERRGSAERIAIHAKAYPSLYEFDSDEDLTLLAQVGRMIEGPDAIWGVEQATGAVRYLEELARMAPDALGRARVEEVLAIARAADPGPAYTVNFLANLETPARLAGLAAVFPSGSDPKAVQLLGGLLKSAEIFGYYTRAEAGEYVGLYNNTVREEELKANFLRRYHAVAMNGNRPKAMFKFGANHLYHGRNPTQAFPIGNLAHELAIVNGAEAYGVFVVALGPEYTGYKDLPAWMRTLLPAVEPTGPVVVNLRAMRRFQAVFRPKIEPAELWQQRTLLHGYDAIVLLPGSKPSVKRLGGR